MCRILVSLAGSCIHIEAANLVTVAIWYAEGYILRADANLVLQGMGCPDTAFHLSGSLDIAAGTERPCRIRFFRIRYASPDFCHEANVFSAPESHGMDG